MSQNCGATLLMRMNKSLFPFLLFVENLLGFSFWLCLFFICRWGRKEGQELRKQKTCLFLKNKSIQRFFEGGENANYICFGGFLGGVCVSEGKTSNDIRN